MRRALFLLSSLLLVQASTLQAQAPPHSSGPLPPIQEGPLANQLYKLRVSRIQQCLGLSEDRAKLIADRWKQYDREFVDTVNRMNPLKDRIEQILRSGSDEAEKNRQIKPLLDQYIQLWKQKSQSRKKFEEDARANLAPAQQARLILLMEQLHQEIGRLLKEQQGSH